jgi:hypothetical protein
LRGKPPAKPPTPADRFAAERAAAKRAALNAVKRARRTADKAGVDLSDWEGKFLGSVEDRVKTYGRAFADPEKGARGQALSIMQTRKLKEIAAKAAGDDRKPWEKKDGTQKVRKGFGRKPRP